MKSKTCLSILLFFLTIEHSTACPVPRDDNDVKICIAAHQDKVLRDSMLGLYQVKRAQGMTVIQAWEHVLIVALNGGKK